MSLKGKSKYDVSVPVCWRDVLRCMRWSLMLHFHSAERWMESVKKCQEHIYPDSLDFYIGLALRECENVFHRFNLLNSVRRFLRYPDMTREQLKISRCFDFYEQYKKESPGSDSLDASTTRGYIDNE